MVSARGGGQEGGRTEWPGTLGSLDETATSVAKYTEYNQFTCRKYLSQKTGGTRTSSTQYEYFVDTHTVSY